MFHDLIKGIIENSFSLCNVHNKLVIWSERIKAPCTNCRLVVSTPICEFSCISFASYQWWISIFKVGCVKQHFPSSLNVSLSLLHFLLVFYVTHFNLNLIWIFCYEALQDLVDWGVFTIITEFLPIKIRWIPIVRIIPFRK